MQISRFSGLIVKPVSREGELRSIISGMEGIELNDESVTFLNSGRSSLSEDFSKIDMTSALDMSGFMTRELFSHLVNIFTVSICFAIASNLFRGSPKYVSA